MDEAYQQRIATLEMLLADRDWTISVMHKAIIAAIKAGVSETVKQILLAALEE